jgi:hypothetical protein
MRCQSARGYNDQLFAIAALAIDYGCGLKHSMDIRPETIGAGAAITCASCKACCCRLEVMLMGDDDIPLELTEVDRWGGHIMARLDDGWCAALDRETMLCRVYDRRPFVCREFEVGASDCIAERSANLR